MENFFAKNLRYLRKRTSRTMEEVATVIGKKKSIIGSYETGQAEPSLTTVMTLAEHFEVPLWKFVETDLQDLPPSLPERGRNLQNFRRKIREIKRITNDVKQRATEEKLDTLRRTLDEYANAVDEFSGEMEMAVFRQERIEKAYFDRYKQEQVNS